MLDLILISIMTYIAMGAFIIVGTPILAYLLCVYGKMFKIKISIKKAIPIIAALAIADIVISYFVAKSTTLQILVGVIIVGVIGAIAFKHAFDLSWPATTIITMIWYVTYQILIFIIPLATSMILFPIVGLLQ